jgi:membrane protease YdiL (CAAX protease family)
MLKKIFGPAGMPPEFQPSWGPWMAAVWIIGIFVFSFFVPLGAVWLGLIASRLPDGSLNYHALAAIADPVAIGCMMVVASRLRLNPFDVLALRRPTRLVRFIAIALAVAAALFAVLVVALVFTDDPLNDPNQKGNEQRIRRFGFFESLLMEGLIVPIKEEVAFRGYLLLSFFGTRLWFWGGAAISSLMFAFLHNPTSLNIVFHLPYFISGLCLAAALRYTGSLWVPIGLHILKNSIGVLSVSLQSS